MLASQFSVISMKALLVLVMITNAFGEVLFTYWKSEMELFSFCDLWIPVVFFKFVERKNCDFASTFLWILCSSSNVSAFKRKYVKKG